MFVEPEVITGLKSYCEDPKLVSGKNFFQLYRQTLVEQDQRTYYRCIEISLKGVCESTANLASVNKYVSVVF